MLGPGHKTFFHPEKNGAKGRKCQDAKKKKKAFTIRILPRTQALCQDTNMRQVEAQGIHKGGNKCIFTKTECARNGQLCSKHVQSSILTMSTRNCEENCSSNSIVRKESGRIVWSEVGV